jgi:hypothetical protein
MKLGPRSRRDEPGSAHRSCRTGVWKPPQDLWRSSSRRTIVRCTVALVFVLLLPASAGADIGIRGIVPNVARPGENIRVTVRGYLGERPWRPMPVVLVHASRTPRPYPCKGGYCTPSAYPRELRLPPYHLLGAVRSWRALDRTGVNAVGAMAVRVPRVRAGRYLLGLFCASCARGPKGSIIIDYRLVLTVRP